MKLMQQHLRLGFHLQLYQAYEMPAVYWQLDYLATCRYQNIMRVQQLQRECLDTGGKQSVAYQPSAELVLENLQMSWEQEMCRGHSRLLRACQDTVLMSERGFRAVEMESAYCYRIRPFTNLSSPDCVPYEQFEEIWHGATTVQILQLAKQAYTNCKTILMSMKKKNSNMLTGGWTPEQITARMKLAFAHEILCTVLMQKLAAGTLHQDERLQFPPSGGDDLAQFPKLSLVR